MKNKQKSEIKEKICNASEQSSSVQISTEGIKGDSLSSEQFELFFNGKGKLETHYLYCGISISFFDLLTDGFSFQNKSAGSTVEIDYCRYGQISLSVGSHDGTCLVPGDFSVYSSRPGLVYEATLPLGYYEGTKIIVDTEKLKEKLPDLLEEAGFNADAIKDNFCNDANFTYFTGNEQTDNIFSLFFDLPENLKLSYYKLKVQELLLYLYRLSEKPKAKLTVHQADTVKKIHKYLMENLNRRITIEELSKRFLMNTTTLKQLFKTVYGVSVATHMKEHRMEKAAVLLRETNYNVEEIARTVGYESQSKFTAAFKSVYEVTPLAYRKLRM